MKEQYKIDLIMEDLKEEINKLKSENWIINFDLLKKTQEINHCLCKRNEKCPCKDFIENQNCICGVFKKS